MELQDLCARPWFMELLWPLLSPAERNSVYSVSRSIRWCVLKTARRCRLGVLLDDDITLQNIRTLSLPSSIRAASPHLPATLALPSDLGAALSSLSISPRQNPDRRKTVTQSLASLPSAPSCVDELHVQLYAPAVELQQLCSKVECLKSLHVEVLTMLPPPSDLPHLCKLTAECCDTINREAVLARFLSYLPQLTELHMVDHTVAQPVLDALAGSDLAPGVAAPKLHTCSVPHPLSDVLLKAVNTRAPQLTALTVTALPGQPLTQPCRLRALTFRHCATLRQLLHVPSSVQRLTYTGKADAISRLGCSLILLGDLTAEEEDRVLTVGERLQPTLLDLRLSPADNVTDYTADLDRQIKFVRRLASAWRDVKLDKVAVRGWPEGWEVLEVNLRGLPPCNTRLATRDPAPSKCRVIS